MYIYRQYICTPMLHTLVAHQLFCSVLLLHVCLHRTQPDPKYNNFGQSTLMPPQCRNPFGNFSLS